MLSGRMIFFVIIIVNNRRNLTNVLSYNEWMVRDMQQLLLESFFCENCGGDLESQPSGDRLQCRCCQSVYSVGYTERERRFLDEALDAQKQDTLRNLTQRMWEQLDRAFVDSEAVVEICREIRNLYPDHFYARFYEVANGGTNREINAFLDSMSVDEEAQVVSVAKFMLRSLTTENVYSMRNLLERAKAHHASSTCNEMASLLNKEARKVNHGVYDCSVPRDVFVACVDEDLEEAQKLVDSLEKQDISCFLVSRNVQRGRDSLKNSADSIKKAISVCKMFVFVSSRNSRKMCDVLRNQVGYLRESDMERIPNEYKQVSYEKIPLGYKKLRAQWRLDDEHVFAAAEKRVNEVFAGVVTCKTLDDLIDQISEYAFSDFEVERPQNEQIASLQRSVDEQFEAMRKAQEEERQRQAEAEAQRRKEAEEMRKRQEMLLERFEQVLSMNPSALNERVSMYERQLKEAPNDAKLNASLGFVYLKLKLYDQALEVFEKAIFTQSNNPEVYFWAGVSKLKGKKAYLTPRVDIDKAEAYVNAALQLNPNKGIYYYFMAYIRYDHHHRKCYKASPNYVQYFNAAKKCGVTLGEVNNLYSVMGVTRPDVL